MKYFFFFLENGKECKRSEPIKCGTVLRLKHLQTSCFLHSHLFKAPISNQFQVIINKFILNYFLNLLFLGNFMFWRFSRKR